VQDYFREIKIQKEWLTDITELRQEGGNHFWTQITPFWCGIADDFYIRSTERYYTSSQPEKIILFYNEENPDILEELKLKELIRSRSKQWLIVIPL